MLYSILLLLEDGGGGGWRGWVGLGIVGLFILFFLDEWYAYGK